MHPKIWCLNFKPQYLQNYSSPTNDLYSVRKRSIGAFKSNFKLLDLGLNIITYNKYTSQTNKHPKRTRNERNRFSSSRPQEPIFIIFIHFFEVFLKDLKNFLKIFRNQ